ncbi:MAG: glutaminyl-peptide cyclotransferase [Halioglobus sp.]
MTALSASVRSLRTRIKTSALIVSVFAALSAPAAQADAPVFSYKVTGKLQQPRENFVQGLQIIDGQLYVSTGNYGQSKLLRYRLSDGQFLDGRSLDERLFGEGLTLFDDKIYQLTWKSGLVLVYDKTTLDGLEYFRVPGQGWGITNNGKDLIYSDGSHRLHFLSPQSKSISRTIEVMENGRPLSHLNELEWIEGQIWANVWQSDRIVMIDPDTGTVTASIDLKGLLPASERQSSTDVLNGIALNPDDKSIWVTGKRWPWLYQIELQAPAETDKQSEAPRDDSR